MTRYILGRVLSLIMVLFVVSIVVFSMMHAVPGGPFDESKGRLPPAAKENIMRKYGLDQPVWRQYLNYMGSALQGILVFPISNPTPP